MLRAMNRAATALLCAAFTLPWLAEGPRAQQPPANGPRTVDPGWFALTGADVVVRPGERLTAANVVVRDGRIVSVGAAPPPAGATVIDCAGLTVYPGLIEPFLTVDVPAPEAPASDAYWHPMVLPQRRALDGNGVPEADRVALRKLGFVAAGIVPTGGIVKGTSAVVLLDDPAPGQQQRIVRDRAYAVASLQSSGGGHPNSQMGAIALLRQSLADADWWWRCMATLGNDPTLTATAPPGSGSLAALALQRELPLWLDARDELEALRLVQVAREFERKAVIVGSGMEFRRVAALAALRSPVVVPLHLPDPPDVGTAAAAEAVTLRQLLTWEQAPTNARRLLAAGLRIAFTTAQLPDRGEFRGNQHKAMQCGVDADAALAALTTVPAELLGVQAQLGTVEAGKLANLVVAEGDLFEPKTKIRDVWVGGRRHVVDAPADEGLDGTWTWTTGWPGPARTAPPELSIDGNRLVCSLDQGEEKPKQIKAAGVQRDATTLTCRMRDDALGVEGTLLLRFYREGDELVGIGTRPDASTFVIRATRAVDKPNDGNEKKDEPRRYEPPDLGPLATPLGGHGATTMPPATDFLLTGATVWPCDGGEPIENGAVLVRDGRIGFVGKVADLPELPAALPRIDATGKHVTPGLIDCHSHTGISRGINEGGQAVTAEARIQDVLDPDDANWYRQLAGGVTAVNQLHGSANAIGGQSQTTKIRYGVADPLQMQMHDGAPGIKWALGENPRRANGSSSDRYPGTRMGVEALIRDRLTAAEAYRSEHARYENLTPQQRARVLPPRRDLELEALAEVISGTRRIHCHSYRQDEIFMLCSIAQEYGIKIGTFQHVLEGYKVADAIAQNAVGGSTFADWWAYKFEVYDAIPENPAIMHEVGVTVSINSDSNEHARRLNTEAGKSVKYGGVAPHEALRFVTANPAIQLGIYHRTGSLTPGKDADLVLWSADPLSYAARCEATWVDGRQLFSLQADREGRARIASERQRLLQKALAAGDGRTAKERDPRDAYWAAEDLSADYCCRETTLGDRR